MKHTIKKRALSCLLSCTLLSACMPAWAGETETEVPQPMSESSTVEDLLSRMTMEEKVAQMFMVTVRSWESEGDSSENEEQAAAPAAGNSEAVPLTSLNDTVSKFISEGRFGGMILYAENCSGGNAQTMELIYEMQAANQDTESDVKIPLLIATDQEGGIVSRLTQGIRGIGSMALSATADPENILKEASIMARELTDVGINLSFAPDIDVNNNPANPVIGVRSFSDEPSTVAQYGGIFMDAMTEGGVITSPKHFPGHGNTDVDSHSGLPLVDLSYDELKECELIPFQSVIDQGAEMIMTAHIQYPQIEKGTWTSISTGEEITLPATLSHTILTDILRGDMGFDGVIVSDALAMDAIAAHFDLADACRLAIEAGVDLILVPIHIQNASDVEQMESLIDRITQMAEDGEIPEERINDAVRRILKLKEKHGLLSPVSGPTQEQKDAVSDLEALKEDIAVEWKHATQAITLLKNDDNALPVHAGENESVLFVCTASSRVTAAELAMEGLKEKGLVPESVTCQALPLSEDTFEEVLKAAAEADHVFVISTAFSTSGFDPNTEGGSSGRMVDELIAAVHEAGRQAVLISAYLPYDAARYQAADAILLTYGSVALNAALSEAQAYMPNLPAAIGSAFGEFAPCGVLPVVIPGLDENYHFTEDVLYDRGTSLTYSE